MFRAYSAHTWRICYVEDRPRIVTEIPSVGPGRLGITVNVGLLSFIQPLSKDEASATLSILVFTCQPWRSCGSLAWNPRVWGICAGNCDASRGQSLATRLHLSTTYPSSYLII